MISTSVGAALLAVALALPAAAAVPVEESVASQRGGVPQQSAPAMGSAQAAPAQSGGAETSKLTQLFYQLQVLQQEVQELRGQVEEQNHQLNRLARDQQEQYLDLDRRMQALRGNTSAAQPSAAQPSGAQPSGAGDRGFRAAQPAAGGSGSEREAYAAAFELMKQRQFDASAEAFNALVADYPNGAYTANAFYWLGELYLAQDDTERARQSFAQVVNLYPDHQKVPDALYKLGVVYHRLGDVARAREYLTQVRRQYPQSSAAGLAQTYLAEL